MPRPQVVVPYMSWLYNNESISNGKKEKNQAVRVVCPSQGGGRSCRALATELGAL